MEGNQNCDPFLGTLNIRGRIIIGIQKGTIILTTTHMRELHGHPYTDSIMDILKHDPLFLTCTFRSTVNPQLGNRKR